MVVDFIVFYSACSLKQQLPGRHVAPLEHIILIPSQPIFAFSTSLTLPLFIEVPVPSQEREQSYLRVFGQVQTECYFCFHFNITQQVLI
jgi:hypothetical protein